MKKIDPKRYNLSLRLNLQQNKLNELLKNGVLTQEEFEKWYSEKETFAQIIQQ